MIFLFSGLLYIDTRFHMYPAAERTLFECLQGCEFHHPIVDTPSHWYPWRYSSWDILAAPVGCHCIVPLRVTYAWRRRACAVWPARFPCCTCGAYARRPLRLRRVETRRSGSSGGPPMKVWLRGDYTQLFSIQRNSWVRGFLPIYITQSVQVR